MIDSNEPNGRGMNETGDTVRLERSISKRRNEDLKEDEEQENKVVVKKKKKTRKETVVGNI